MKLSHIQEARYLSTKFVELVSQLLKNPDNDLHSRYIDIKAMPEAVRQLTTVFGEPHISRGTIKDSHRLGTSSLPRVNSRDSSFVAYSWEKNVPAKYVAIDAYTDGREDTATLYVDKRGKW